MARPHIEFIEAIDVEPAEVADGEFAGACERVLSRDEEGGDYTALSTFPAGWSRDVASERPLELFVIRGELELDGQAMRPGCYAYVPSGSSRGVLRALERTEALVMVEPARPAEADGPIEVIDQATRRFTQAAHALPRPDGAPAPSGPARAEGIVIKLLRVDPETSDWTWVAGIVPGWTSPQIEVHPTVEEAFLLRGDILLGKSGAMTAGSYFWRPGMVRHGPMCSRDGSLVLLRTKGGGLETSWTEEPGWEKMVGDYAGKSAFYAGPGEGS